MTTRIPPSLKWLIDKRARLNGEILKTQKSLEKAHELINELKSLNETLAAIDKTLELHDIKIDISNIPPIRSSYVRLKLPHGSLTRSILTCLRLCTTPLQPLDKSQIVDFIIARHTELNEPETSRAEVAISVKYALKRLLKSGVVKRHHEPDYLKNGLWSVPD